MNGNLAYKEPVAKELINGEVVAMSPSPIVNHSMIARNISYLFYDFLKGKQCIPFGDGTDLYLSKKDKFIPDGMIVCDRSKIKSNGVYGAPDLVIEILSPSTAKGDRGYKKETYEKYGVTEYWIISPQDKIVEVYLLEDGKYKLDNTYASYPDYLLENMTEEEKKEIVTTFRCHLYDDLIISIEDIFRDTVF